MPQKFGSPVTSGRSPRRSLPDIDNFGYVCAAASNSGGVSSLFGNTKITDCLHYNMTFSQNIPFGLEVNFSVNYLFVVAVKGYVTMVLLTRDST